MLEQIKQNSLGNWESMAVEVRPGSFRNEDGTLKPFYLKRSFTFLPENQFELEIINYADPYANVPLAKMLIGGRIEWQGTHSVAEGAYKADFIADEFYEVMPLYQGFADLLNTAAKEGFEHWETGKSQSILKKKFLPFGLAEGQIFKEYDLIYIFNDMMFWGARHVDGRGFDTEENRPANLQIPMVRK
ncbi:hypothetical protein ACM46_07685 [Chryseobacterium angstadtii]|uniref:APCDD1 domain-containing protein n=1 Tax=Chryseobacterium angstadtii TaxID=558151 RepID=A0A0J7IIC7_9FLAO|nr:hypothetical protein [Chryseobacterium angstadtii]KMQ65736.1 hypothetical protein ACM46_07685 [Chryseobacterium angstadtii]